MGKQNIKQIGGVNNRVAAVAHWGGRETVFIRSTLVLLMMLAAACGSGQPYDDEVGTPGQKDGASDVAPSVSSFVAQAFAEEEQFNIVLNYTDLNNDKASLCSVANATHVLITQACACTDGVCSVGVTGAKDFVGEGWFNYTVTANGKTSNSASVTFTITNVDDAPVVNAFSASAFNEDAEGLITLNYTDVDGDLASTCSVSQLDKVTETVPCQCVLGVCTVGVMGAANYAGTASFNFVVSANGQSAAESAKATLTISQVDDAPEANAITPAAINEDTQSIVTLSYTDQELDLASACTISSALNVSVTQACTCVAGVCTVGVTGDLNYNGEASFAYSVSANGKTSNTATATLTIDPVNDAPVLSNNMLYPTRQGTTITLSSGYLDFNDVDDLDSAITYQITSAPSKGLLKSNGSTLSVGSTFTQQNINANLLTYQHTAADTIDDVFGFRVYDDENAESAQATTASPAQFNINISDCAGGIQTFTADGSFTLPVGCSVLVVKAWGGGGGAGVGPSGKSSGGPGGYSLKTVSSSAGAQFNIVVGNGGFSACNGRTAGTGGYAGGAGGVFKVAGSAGLGSGVGGAGGKVNNSVTSGVGGAGKYGGGGGGGGKDSGHDGGGGGGASLLETSGGTDLVIAGGGGGGGGSSNARVPNGGSGCGAAGTDGDSGAGGGGGGGACEGDTTVTGSGTVPGNSAEAGAAAAGGAGSTCSNGTNGKVIIEYL